MRASLEMLYPKAADGADYKLLAGEAMKQVAVDIDPPIVLAPDFEPWFKDAVADGRVKLERWYSYKQFLTHRRRASHRRCWMRSTRPAVRWSISSAIRTSRDPGSGVAW